MKNLIIILVALLSTALTYATEPTDPPTEKNIYLGHYRQNVNYLGKVERNNTFIYKAKTLTTFDRLTKQFLIKNNKEFIKDATIVVKYKNKQTRVKL